MSDELQKLSHDPVSYEKNHRLASLVRFGCLLAALAFCLIFASTLATAFLLEEALGRRIVKVALLNAGGGALALSVLWLLWDFFLPYRRLLTVLFFLVASCAMIIGIFAFHLAAHLVYFSQWHAPFFTVTYLYQLIFTAVGLAAIFLTRGLIYLAPLALLAPLLMAWALKRVSRSVHYCSPIELP